MKTNSVKRISVFMFASTLLLSTACVNQIESETDIKEGNIPINFSIKIKETATKVSENAFETGDEIGVYAMITGNKLNEERYIDNLLLKYSTGNNLIPQKPVFYPEGDATLDFIAYYPYQSDGVSTDSTIIPISIHTDQSIAANRSASDFMTAITEEISNSSSSVSLNFHHRLAKLKINLLPGENEDLDEMLAANPRIIATNFYIQAYYDLSAGKISKLNHTADIVSAGEWKKTDGKLSGKEFIFIPQNIDDTQTLQMEWNGRIYTCQIPSITQFEGNKLYELEINAEETESLELEGIMATIQEWPVGEPLENTENEYTNQVLHLSVLSFEPSNIYRIYQNGKEVAEICKEYLTGKLNSTAITTYPLHNGTPDLTKGTVLQLLDTTENINGGTINWNLEENTFTYEGGNQPIIRQIYFDETGALQIGSSTPPANINVVAYTLRDMRDVNEIINYPIIKVGTQYWMRENLRATCYANGTYIEPQGKLDGTAGYFNTGDIYFYNGEALEAGEISPDGWHLPAAEDWQALNKYVNEDASMLKGGEWRILSSDPNSEIGNPVNNLTMFSILPLGQWSHSGGHVNLNQAAGFWTWDYDTNSIAKETVFFSGQSDEMQMASTQASGQNFSKALSVRCLKRE